MLNLAGIVLGAAGLSGLAPVALMQRPQHAGRSGWPAMGHGLLGAAGLIVLVLSQQGPRRGLAEGASQFGVIALGLISAALLAGLTIWIVRLRGKQPLSLLVGMHATFAVAGIVMLLAYISSD